MRALMSANNQAFVAVSPPLKDDWLSAVPGATLQDNCNISGLNVRARQTLGLVDRVRIGILSNNEDDCNSPDSYVGIGTNLAGSNVAGNRGANGADRSRHAAVLVRSVDLTELRRSDGEVFRSCDDVIAAGFVDAEAIYLVGGQLVTCAP
jgi:hypothetical protein